MEHAGSDSISDTDYLLLLCISLSAKSNSAKFNNNTFLDIQQTGQKIQKETVSSMMCVMMYVRLYVCKDDGVGWM